MFYKKKIYNNEKKSSSVFLNRNSEFFTSRNAFVGRTAKLHNFVLNYDKMKRYPLNPLDENPEIDGKLLISSAMFYCRYT